MSGLIGSSGGINAQIPLEAGQGVPQQPNPLATIGSILDIRNKQNQLQLFPGQQQLQQQAIQGGQVGLSQHINQAVNQGLTPLLAMPPGTINHAALTSALASIEGRGIPTAGETVALSQAPQGDGPAFDQWVRSRITSQAMASPESSVAAVTGTPANMNTGQAVQPGVVAGPGAPGFGGFTPSGGATQVYPSRGELAGRVAGPPTSTGAPTSVPLGAVTDSSLSGMNVGPGRPNVPSSLVGPHAPALPGQIATGLDPATAQELPARAQQSVASFGNVANEGQRAQEQNAVLSNMRNDLENFKAGPGAHDINQLQKVIQGWVPGLNNAYKTKIAAQESFDKLANQLVTTAEPGSDARQAVLQGANPNSAQSPEGVDFILRQLQGVNDYKSARSNLAAAPGVNRNDYPGWQSQSSANLDPRVFQFARLTPEQKRTYFQSLPAGERATFKQKYMQSQQSDFYGVNNGAQ